MAEPIHKWRFLLSSESNANIAYVLAVCETCGLIRAQAAPVGSVWKESVIDLRGTCPGEPKDPPANPL